MAGQTLQVTKEGRWASGVTARVYDNLNCVTAAEGVIPTVKFPKPDGVLALFSDALNTIGPLGTHFAVKSDLRCPLHGVSISFKAVAEFVRQLVLILHAG